MNDNIELENDEEIQKAMQLLDEYKKGTLELHEVDFLGLEDSGKICDNIQEVLIPHGYDLYVETEEIYDDGEIVACNLYIWCATIDEIHAIKDKCEITRENGFLIKNKKVAFTTHLENKANEWVYAYYNEIKEKYNICCHIEWLY